MTNPDPKTTETFEILNRHIQTVLVTNTKHYIEHWSDIFCYISLNTNLIIKKKSCSFNKISTDMQNKMEFYEDIRIMIS